MDNKEVNRKEYTFQNIVFKMKPRSLKIRKDSYLLLNDFLKHAKNFEGTDNGLALASMTFFSDENKLKELFTLLLEGEIDKISYDAEDDAKYMEMIEMAGKLFTDFFSYILPQQKKISKKLKH